MPYSIPKNGNLFAPEYDGGASNIDITSHPVVMRLQSEVAMLRQREEDLQKSITRLEQDRDKELESLNNKLEEHISEVKAKGRQIERLRGLEKNLQQQNEKNEKEMELLKRMCEEYKAECISLRQKKSDLEKAENIIANKDQQSTMLSRTIEDLRRRIEEVIDCG